MPLAIHVTDQQQQTLTALAALQGKTIMEYAIDRLFSSESDEERALLELKGLLQHRVAEAEAGDVDTRSITDIAKGALHLALRRD